MSAEVEAQAASGLRRRHLFDVVDFDVVVGGSHSRHWLAGASGSQPGRVRFLERFGRLAVPSQVRPIDGVEQVLAPQPSRGRFIIRTEPVRHELVADQTAKFMALRRRQRIRRCFREEVVHSVARADGKDLAKQLELVGRYPTRSHSRRILPCHHRTGNAVVLQLVERAAIPWARGAEVVAAWLVQL